MPKLTVKRGAKSVIPDGTLRDEYNLHRGYWEAKESADNLAAEIGKKSAKDYALTNTIFEDTRRAVLFQNGREAFNADLTEPQQLADLLNAFYGYVEPEIARLVGQVVRVSMETVKIVEGLPEIDFAASGQ